MRMNALGGDKMRLKKSDLLRALLCATAIPTFAAAQTTASAPAAKAADNVQTIQEVIVTSERRTSSVQRTAAAVTVRTGIELVTEGKFTTRDILEDIPGLVAVNNVSLNSGSADVQGNNITIRGVTPGSSAGGGPSGISAVPPTAVYVDGVYEGVGSNYDIDRVEVLRGPQGTLYGRSATAGVVAFHTRDPVLDKYSGNVSIEEGDYELQHYTGGVNVPLGDKLAVRFAADYYDQNQAFYGDDKYGGKRQRENGRVKLLWQPTSDLSVLLGYAYENDNSYSGGTSYTANGPNNTSPNSTGTTPLTIYSVTNPLHLGNKIQREYWAEINWNLGFGTLTYQPTYRTWNQNDDLLTSADFLGSGLPLEQHFITPVDQFQTHELRIASNGDSQLHWLSGLFYYSNRLNNTNNNGLVGPTGNSVALLSVTSDNKMTENLGYFAEGTYSPISSLRLTLGGRYDYTSITDSEFFYNNIYALCGTAVQFAVGPAASSCTGPAQSSLPQPQGASLNNVTIKFYNFTYKARAEYDLTAKNMLYGLVASGFRPGDVGIYNDKPNIYNAEKLTSIEFGSKNRFLDNALQLNLAAYYYIYDGFQVSYNPDTGPGSYASINSLRTTVPARNLGAELEMLYRPTAHDQFGFNYSYVQSRWVDKPAEFAAAQTETYRAMVPHTVTANYRHVFDLPGGSRITARVDGKYESAYVYQNLQVELLTLPAPGCGSSCSVNYGNYAKLPGEATGNAQITWTSPDRAYSVTGYVRNFTDTKYLTYTVGTPPFAAQWNDPRVFGVILSASF